LHCFAIDCLSIGSSVHSETVWYSGGDGHYTRLGCIRHIRPLQDLQFARKNNTLSNKVRSTAGISNRATNETHISRKVFSILIMFKIIFIMLYIYSSYICLAISDTCIQWLDEGLYLRHVLQLKGWWVSWRLEAFHI